MRKTVALTNVLIVFVTLLVTAQTVIASKAALKIEAVEFSGQKGLTLVILGKQFLKRDGSSPSVSIKSVGELRVVNASDEEIVAKIPSGLEGSYTLTVTTGAGKKDSFDYPLALGGTISVVCIDWYLTAGHDNHIHAEAFLQDQYGNPVIGATVEIRNTVDTGTEIREWLLLTSTTGPYRGYNHGASCPLSVAKESGASDQHCCIGLGAQEPFCPSGYYQGEVLNVRPAPGSNAKWDGKTPWNGREFVMDQYDN